MKNVFLVFTLSLFILWSGCKKDEGLTDGDHKAKFIKAMGTNAQGVDLKQTSDGGYILLGVTQGAGSQDIYVKKVDAFGNDQWSKTYDGPLGGTDEEIAGLDLISDGKFAIAGTTIDTTNDGDQISSTFLMIIDQMGNVVNMNTYNSGKSSTAFIQHETCFDINVSLNDEILIVSERNVLNNTNDVIVASLARLINTNNYGLVRIDSSDVSKGGEGKNIRYNSCFVNSTNHLVISGSTNKDNDGGGFLLNVIKTEGVSQGIIKDIQFGSSNEIGKSIIETQDLETVIAGSIGSIGAEDIFVAKIVDVLADTPDPIWKFSLDKTGNQSIFDIIELEDGYVLAGYTEVSNNRQFYVVKIDKNGNSILWEKEYGYTGFDEAKAVIATKDNGLAVLGTSSDERGNLVMTLLKLDSSGNLK